MNGCSNNGLTSRWSACLWWAAPCRCSDRTPRPISPPSHSRTAPAPWPTLNRDETAECSQCFAGITHNGSAGRGQPNICHRRITWVTQEVWFGTRFLCWTFVRPPPPPLKAENSSKYEMFLILDSFTLLRSNKSLWQGNLSLILRLIRAETEMMRRESAPPFKVGQEKDQQAGNRGVLLCLQ